jgi:biotin carboxylase
MSFKQRFFLCITCEFKGGDFIEAIHALGHKAYLVTSEKTRSDAWPHHAIEEAFYMPESDGRLWSINDLLQGTAYLFRHQQIDRIIALDDYDVSKAALMREEFRLPGMGQTTARHFFDKLAMRMVAKEAGILVPEFTGLFNNDEIHRFFGNSEGPWLVKPRMDAGALGIRKLHSEADFWNWEREIGERRHKFLVEEFKPGDILHVDTLIMDYKLLFHRASEYLNPPFDIAHGGGIFQSHTLESGSKDDVVLKKLNLQVLKAFGLKHGASHSEFIRNRKDGKFYFLETSARVGGAHLAEMVEAASGVNLWKEWANIELALLAGNSYKAPKQIKENAGIIVTLSKYEHIDYGQFQEEEVWWTLPKAYHVGLIVKHPKRERILELLGQYAHKIHQEFSTSVPLKE